MRPVRPFRSRRSKALVVGLAGLALLTAGCSGRDSGDSGSSPSADASALGTPNKATGSPIKIGFVIGGKGPNLDTSGAVTTAQDAADYANEYLGGINGHKIDLVTCVTKWTPAGGTQCGIDMVNAGVAAVVAPAFGEDTTLSAAIDGKDIAYVTTSSAQSAIMNNPGFYIMGNPFGALDAALQIAKKDDLKQGATVIVDVPAAAAVGAIAQPLYDEAGVKQDFIQISMSAADTTGRMQQAVDDGNEFFIITGDETFNANVLKGLGNTGFEGPRIMSLREVSDAFKKDVGDLSGVINVVSTTTDPKDPDVQTYNAATAKYSPGTQFVPDDALGFSSVLSLVGMLEGATKAVDGKTVIEALNTMPKPTPLFLGGGIMLQCGQKPIAFIPNACTTDFLQATLDKDGNATAYEVGSGGS